MSTIYFIAKLSKYGAPQLINRANKYKNWLFVILI